MNVKRLPLQWLYLVLILILLSSCTSRYVLSLNSENEKLLKKELSNLNKNTLIVRLYTNQKKTAFLKANDQKAYKKHIAEREEYAQLMMDVWKKNYSFSEILFMPDSLYKSFLKDNGDRVFINDQMVIDETKSLTTPDYYILGRGDRDLSFLWYNSNSALLEPQPPVVFDKFTIWELMVGKEEILNYRVKDLNDYFTALVSKND